MNPEVQGEDLSKTTKGKIYLPPKKGGGTSGKLCACSSSLGGVEGKGRNGFAVLVGGFK